VEQSVPSITCGIISHSDSFSHKAYFTSYFTSFIPERTIYSLCDNKKAEDVLLNCTGQQSLLCESSKSWAINKPISYLDPDGTKVELLSLDAMMVFKKHINAYVEQWLSRTKAVDLCHPVAVVVQSNGITNTEQSSRQWKNFLIEEHHHSTL
jgi:hypothetical protein